jgi:hypothetical protein
MECIWQDAMDVDLDHLLTVQVSMIQTQMILGLFGQFKDMDLKLLSG